MMSSSIHIVCAADARYGAYAGIMLASVLAHNQPARLHCHLLSDGVSESDLNRCREMFLNAGASFDIYMIREALQQFDYVSDQAHYTRAAYARLLIAGLLPTSLSKIIYVDCDVVCIADLSDLWKEAESIKFLAAVRDEWADQDPAYKQAIGMSPDAIYYNTGVLPINLDEWRKRNFTQQIHDYLAVTPKALLRYADQDAINALAWHDIAELDPKWNALITSPDAKDWRRDLSNAAIVHFCGGFKPWQLGYGLAGRWGASIFRQAKMSSPWRWKVPDLHLARIKRKLRDLNVR